MLPFRVSAADIRVYSGGAPQEVLRTLAPQFERQTGLHVVFTFALVTEIQRKLAAGEPADVVLLPRALLAATEKTVALRMEAASHWRASGSGSSCGRERGNLTSRHLRLYAGCCSMRAASRFRMQAFRLVIT
ncbi:MAG: substrate-binding domain-containing protein [Burkholderiales bacterium]